MAEPNVSYVGPIVTLKEAREAGSPSYFTGKPCCRGHICLRYVAGRACRECLQEYPKKNPEKISGIQAAFRVRHRSRIRAKHAAWMAENPERQREFEVKYRENNPDAVVESSRSYRERNPLKCKETGRSWRQRNPEKNCARTARRRATKLRATPQWADPDEILSFYKEARFLTKSVGRPYHVDHIVPLKSKWVCGLHCPANLRVVVGRKNISKGNRYWPDMGAIADLI